MPPRRHFSASYYASEMQNGRLARDIFAQFCEELSSLESPPLGGYARSDLAFLDGSLESIVQLFLRQPNRFDDFQAVRFALCRALLRLSVRTSFLPPSLRAIRAFFASETRERAVPRRIPLSPEERALWLEMESPILKLPAQCAMAPLIELFYKSSAFRLIRRRIAEGSFTIPQFGLVLQILCSTFHSLNEPLCATLCFHFARSIGRVRTDSGTDTRVIIDFFLMFTPYIEDTCNKILKFLVRLAVNPATEKHVINDLLRFSSAMRSEKACAKVKQALLTFVNRLTDPVAISEIYRYLSNTERLRMGCDDLISMLAHSRSLPEECGQAIVTILGQIRVPVTPFCCHVLSCHVFSPLVHIALIEHCEDDSVATALFVQLLQYFEEHTATLKNRPISVRLRSLLAAELASASFQSYPFCNFLAALPYCDLISQFLTKLLDFEALPDGLSDAMEGLLLGMEKADADATLLLLLDLFCGAIAHSGRGPAIWRLLVRWITVIPSLSPSELFQRVAAVNFAQCTDGLPQIISALSARAESLSYISSLFSKIARDTVPPKFAHWAIEFLFTCEREEPQETSEWLELLFKSFCDSDRRKNAIHMFYWGVVFESDFHKFPRHHNFVFNQKVIVDDKDYVIPLHPFHSARRFYWRVSKLLRVDMSRFNLLCNNQELGYSAPLVGIKLHWDRPLMLQTVRLTDPVPGRVDTRAGVTDFLRAPDRLDALFSGMSEATRENETLFEILVFLGAGLFHQRSSSFLQRVLTHELSEGTECYSRQVFPYFLLARLQQSEGATPTFLRALAESQFDTVSLALVCQTLAALPTALRLELHLVRQCLIDCPHELVREAVARLVSDEVPTMLLFTLLRQTRRPANRGRTGPFFQLLKRRGITPALVEPFYGDLPQFEESYYGEPDETFIGLLSLLDQTPEIVQLTFDRLFAAPTCAMAKRPFVHTEEARTAGLAFLARARALPQLAHLAAAVPAFTESPHAISENLFGHIRGAIRGPQCGACLLALLSGIDAFAESLIATPFIHPLLCEVSCVLADLRRGAGSAIRLSSGFSPSSDIPELIGSLFALIDRELGSRSILPSLFRVDVDDRSCYCYSINIKQFTAFAEIPLHFARWPEVLLLHLHRESLTQPFEVPFMLRSPAGAWYSVIGLLCGESDGIFHAIIHGPDWDWFLFDHEQWRFVEMSDLPKWCFDNHDTTNLLLVFTRVSARGTAERQICPAVARHVDARNAVVWPSIVCSAPHFIDFLRQFACERRSDDSAIGVVCRVFSGIVVHDPLIMEQWREWFGTLLREDGPARVFISHMWGEIGPDLMRMVGLRDGRKLADLFLMAHRTTRIAVPFRQLARMFAHRQSQDAVAFACRLITRGLFEPTAASPWQAILNLLSDLKACCDSVVVVDRLLDAFDATMAAAATTLATESAPGLAFQIVSPAFLELWLDYAQKSQHFLNAIKAIPYEQLGDFHALPPAVQDLLTKGVTIKSRIDISQFPILPFETFCKMFAKGIFAEIATVRSNLLNLTCELFPAPPSELITFINYSVLLEDLAPPPAFPECPLAQSLLTLFPAALDRLRSNRPIFEEFFQLIEAIFFVAPRSVSVLAPDLVAAFTLSAVDAPHVPALFSILHHLMVFDHTFLESLTPGVVAKIATVPAGSRTGIHMAFLLQGAADESVLVGACVEFALGSVFDENADLLLRMIEGGLRPGPFTVPRVLSDPLALRIANALWRAVPDLHDRLTPPMRAALRMAKPADVFRLSSCVQDAVRYVGLPR